MSQPYLGQVLAVAFNFTPVGWQACDGSLLPISEYNALFALLGTTYGGNGTTNFAVPDLRGRSPLNQGQGAGLSPAVLGQAAGNESVTLTVGQLPSHTHTLNGSANPGAGTTPGSSAALGTGVAPNPFAAAPGNTTLAPAAIGLSPGNSLPHENRQPFLVVNYIIAVNGIFPSQN